MTIGRDPSKFGRHSSFANFVKFLSTYPENYPENICVLEILGTANPPMSALPPKADIRCHDRHVRFVPEADISLLIGSVRLQRFAAAATSQIKGMAAPWPDVRRARPQLKLR